MTSDIKRDLALIEEVTCAIYLIQEGLLALNKLSGANDFSHFPIMLLSSGFERLLKMVICLDHLEREGRFPDSKKFMKRLKTHDIERLLEWVIGIAKAWSYDQRCVAVGEDMVFLEKDCDLQRLVKLLADYGQSARYYNMNVIVGEKNLTDDPMQLFESYCLDVFKRQPDWKKRITDQDIDISISYDNRQMTILLQRFARALCRMFTLGKLGQKGRQMSGIITVFLCLRDTDLGEVRPRWFEPKNGS